MRPRILRPSALLLLIGFLLAAGTSLAAGQTRPSTPPRRTIPPPTGVQASFDPASHRVCPSPLFGRVLYSRSGPRCVGERMTLFRGSVFDLPDEWVCARCTPNCFFAWDAVASQLICVVTGVPPRPPATRISTPSGSWRRRGGSQAIVITGDGPGYDFTGTDGHYKHQGTIHGDGRTFEGALKDVPGFCCGREGYAWIEAIDADTFRLRSVWWTPGQGNRESPQLTYGWDTWERGAGGPPAAAAPEAPPSSAPEDLSARKKAMGEDLNRVRIEGRWSPDHHYQVGVFLGNARTSAGLDAIDTLIRDYAGCYATKNAETDRIQAAARAGHYATPGDRIGALNRATAVFNACIDAAVARWKGAPSRD